MIGISSGAALACVAWRFKQFERCEIVLKHEQETAVNNLLRGRDVIAVLKTGFGKKHYFFFLSARQTR